MGTWTIVNDTLAVRSHIGSWGYEENAMGLVGGYDSSDSYLASAEEYDGTSWTAANSSNLSRRLHRGGGPLTAGVVGGGRDSVGGIVDTEEYDGTSWTAVNDMLVARRTGGSAGTAQNAVAIWCGYQVSAATEEYDGTSWSNGGNYFAAALAGVAGSGAMSAIISVGGENPSFWDTSAEYNGTTWSQLADIPTTFSTGSVGGTLAYAIAVGSRSSYTNYDDTIQYNGTSWALETAPNQPRGYQNTTAGASGDSAVIAAGSTHVNGLAASGGLDSTEEWDDIPICWNYTARYLGSSKLFKLSGPGSFPRYLQVPSNVDRSTGRMIDDGIEIDPEEYEVNN